MKQADIAREYGPFDDIEGVHGVTFDGSQVWFASGDRINALDPSTGRITRHIDVVADAGTAFDGTHFFQIAGSRIHRIDARTGVIVSSIPGPTGNGMSGLTWAEGMLWVGEYRERRIHQLDPSTGKVLRTLQSDRFVTGVTWVDGALWHGTWEKDESELRRVDAATGAVQESLSMPPGTNVSGLEAGTNGEFYCGGGGARKVRVVRRPGKA